MPEVDEEVVEEFDVLLETMSPRVLYEMSPMNAADFEGVEDLISTVQENSWSYFEKEDQILFDSEKYSEYLEILVRRLYAEMRFLAMFATSGSAVSTLSSAVPHGSKAFALRSSTEARKALFVTLYGEEAAANPQYLYRAWGMATINDLQDLYELAPPSMKKSLGEFLARTAEDYYNVEEATN